jgi:hypothetical protein
MRMLRVALSAAQQRALLEGGATGGESRAARRFAYRTATGAVIFVVPLQRVT